MINPLLAWTGIPVLLTTSALLTIATYRRILASREEESRLCAGSVACLSVLATASLWTATGLLIAAAIGGGVLSPFFSISVQWWLFFYPWASISEVLNIIPLPLLIRLGSEPVDDTRRYVEYASLLVALCISFLIPWPVSVPLCGLYMAFASCQMVWDFCLPDGAKEWLGFPVQEVRRPLVRDPAALGGVGASPLWQRLGAQGAASSSVAPRTPQGFTAFSGPGQKLGG